MVGSVEPSLLEEVKRPVKEEAEVTPTHYVELYVAVLLNQAGA